MAATATTASKLIEAIGDGQAVGVVSARGGLERHGQALMGKSEVGPSDSESALGWPDSIRV